MFRGLTSSRMQRLDVTDIVLNELRRGSRVQRKEVARSIVYAALVGVAYFGAMKLGFATITPSGPISVFWPPNAVLLSTLLLAPRRNWWLLIAMVLPFHLAGQLSRGVGFATSIGWFFGNVGEALIGAYLITEVQTARECFQRSRGLVVFLAFGVFGAPLVTSFLDAAVVVLTGAGSGYWYLWTSRLLSNMLAAVTIAPTIILFCLDGFSWFRKATLAKYLEGALLVCAVALVSMYAMGFEESSAAQVRLFYGLLPLLLWASMRFGVGCVSATLSSISFLAVWGAMHGRGPFLALSSGSVVAMQLFLCVISLPFMFLAVVLVQQYETASSLRQSRSLLIDSQEDERRRIARELHDGVGQSLALAQIEVLQLIESCELAVRPKLEILAEQLSEISGVTREISHGLHPLNLEVLGLAGALNKLCRESSQEGFVKIEFVDKGLPARIDPDTALSLYRVAQEALHNVAKYSHASHVEVSVRMKAGRLWLDVVDDGIGFTTVDEDDKEGLGLESMRERVELLGGKFAIKSAPRKGTRIRASVPLRYVA
jgi:signal transduction histidine kinase